MLPIHLQFYRKSDFPWRWLQTVELKLEKYDFDVLIVRHIQQNGFVINIGFLKFWKLSPKRLHSQLNVIIMRT
jgi:hypothetical protein